MGKSKYRTVENNEGTHILYDNTEVGIKPTLKEALYFIAIREEQRAEAAEARAAHFEAATKQASTDYADAVTKYAAQIAQLEAQLTGAAQVVVTLTAERDAAQRTIEEQASEIEELRHDLMDSGALWITPEDGLTGDAL